MRRRDPPFGNDLQDDFDVKVIGGKIVYLSKCAPIAHSESTDAHKKPSRSQDMGLLFKENVKVSTSQNSSNSPKEILRLPPITQTTGRVHKNKFHSAPPKLHCLDTQIVPQPANNAIPDALSMFISHLMAVQRKQPHAVEDIIGSCTRLDDRRSGTISLQELRDVLYVNGISVSMEILKEYVDHNKLTSSNDGNQVLYKDFVHRMTQGHNGDYTSSKMITHSLNSSTNNFQGTCGKGCSKSGSPVLHRQHLHKREDDFNDHTQSGCLPSHTAMSCPERQTATATTLGSYGSIVEDDMGIDDISVLLGDLQSCFVGTRWGSYGDVQQLQSALAKADKCNSGCLPAAVISHIFYDRCVPLRGQLLDETFMRCEAAQGMIRWAELMELIIKALPRPYLTVRPVVTERGTHHSTTNHSSKLHTNMTQQEDISQHAVAKDTRQQQVEELFKRENKADELLQKLCNALYTCDPHRTGFLEIKTAIRMVRNYNIVYRMGINMLAMESFIKANGTKNRSYHIEASTTNTVINVSLIVDQLLQELGYDQDYDT